MAIIVLSLAVTIPLYSAIWSCNLEMLDHVFTKGFNLNIMPLMVAIQYITLAITIIVHCNP